MSKRSCRKILRELGKHRAAIRRFGVRRLGLFGSYARNQASQRSDLDFVVEFEKKSFDSYMDLKMYLGRLFRRDVDLVIKDAIKPRLKSAILRETIYAPRL